MFQFGAGAHICLGQHIALMEVYKLVPSLLRTYEVRCELSFFPLREGDGFEIADYVELDFSCRPGEGMDDHPGREREADGRLRSDEEKK